MYQVDNVLPDGLADHLGHGFVDLAPDLSNQRVSVVLIENSIDRQILNIDMGKQLVYDLFPLVSILTPTVLVLLSPQYAQHDLLLDERLYPHYVDSVLDFDFL